MNGGERSARFAAVRTKALPGKGYRVTARASGAPTSTVPTIARALRTRLLTTLDQ